MKTLWCWTKTEEIFSGWLKQIHKRVTLVGKTDPGELGWQLPSNERGFCDWCELEPMGGLSCHHWTEKEQRYYLGFCEIKRNATVIGCLNTFRLRISSGAWHWVQTKVACSLLCRRCLWCWSNCFRLTFATPLRSLMECCHRDCSAMLKGLDLLPFET